MCLLSNYCLWLIVVHFLWKINAFSCREILPDLLSSSPQRKESGVGRLFDPNMTFLIVTTNSILFQRGNSKKSMFLMSFWFSDLSDLTYEGFILPPWRSPNRRMYTWTATFGGSSLKISSRSHVRDSIRIPAGGVYKTHNLINGILTFGLIIICT